MKSKATITKQKIVEYLHHNVGFAKSVIEKLIVQIFDEITAILKNGGNVQLPNFGMFSVSKKNARPGMNMRTKERVIIASREVIRFVPSRALKNRMNIPLQK